MPAVARAVAEVTAQGPGDEKPAQKRTDILFMLFVFLLRCAKEAMRKQRGEGDLRTWQHVAEQACKEVTAHVDGAARALKCFQVLL